MCRSFSCSCSLFVDTEPVAVVLQNDEGNEVDFTIGDQEDATLSWKEFHETSTKDLATQDYLKTEAECLGVLGDRFIMQTGRINKAGEVYLEAFLLATLNEAGKITMLESFSNVAASSLVGAASEK